MRTVGYQTEPGRSRISGHHFSWHRAPSPAMMPMHVCAGIE